MLKGGPLFTNAHVGLPTATISLINSFCPLSNSRVGRSPKWFVAQPSRLVLSFPPTNKTIASACLATSTASAIFLLLSSALAKLIVSANQLFLSVIVTPSAYKTFRELPYFSFSACNGEIQTRGLLEYPPSKHLSALGPIKAIVLILFLSSGKK